MLGKIIDRFKFALRLSGEKDCGIKLLVSFDADGYFVTIESAEGPKILEDKREQLIIALKEVVRKLEAEHGLALQVES